MMIDEIREEPRTEGPEDEPLFTDRPLAVLARLALLAIMAVAIAISVSELLAAEKARPSLKWTTQR